MPTPSHLASICASLLFIFPLYAQELQPNQQAPPPANQMPAPAPTDTRPPITSKDVIPPDAAKPAEPVAPTAPVAPAIPTPTVPPADVPPVLIKLEDGTPVHLILSETISSADAQVGQTLELEVVDDIVLDGVCVVPHGSTAWATVTSAQAKRRLGRAGHLDINIDKVKIADGEKVLLRAVKDEKGGSHTGAMTGAIVATSLVLLPAAPLFLLVHGKDVTIPKGTPITAFVQGDQTLNKAKFHPLGQ
jgi:hypothetical protein